MKLKGLLVCFIYLFFNVNAYAIDDTVSASALNNNLAAQVETPEVVRFTLESQQKETQAPFIYSMKAAGNKILAWTNNNILLYQWSEQGIELLDQGSMSHLSGQVKLNPAGNTLLVPHWDRLALYQLSTEHGITFKKNIFVESGAYWQMDLSGSFIVMERSDYNTNTNVVRVLDISQSEPIELYQFERGDNESVIGVNIDEQRLLTVTYDYNQGHHILHIYTKDGNEQHYSSVILSDQDVYQAMYDSDQNLLVVHSYSDLRLYRINEELELELLEQKNLSELSENAIYNLRLQPGQVLGESNGNLLIVPVSEYGFGESGFFSFADTNAYTVHDHHVFRATEHSITIFSRENSEYKELVQLRHAEHDLVWSFSNEYSMRTFALRDKLFIRTSADQAIIYEVEANGEIAIKKQLSRQQIYPDVQYSENKVIQINEVEFLAFAGSRYNHWRLADDEVTLQLVATGDLRTSVEEHSELTWFRSGIVYGDTLFVNTISSIYAFNLAESLILIDQMEGLGHLHELSLILGDVLMVRSHDGISAIRLQDGKLMLVNSLQSGLISPNARMYVSGNFLYAANGNRLTVLKFENDHFALVLTDSSINASALYFLNEQTFLTHYGHQQQLYQVNPFNGEPIYVQDVTDLVDDFYQLHTVGVGAVVESRWIPRVISSLSLEHAPLVYSNLPDIHMNEGQQNNWDLAEAIKTPHDAATFFNLESPLQGIALNTSGQLTFDGTLPTETELAVIAENDSGLFTRVQLPLSLNRAPVLDTAMEIPAVHQGKSYVLDLNNYIKDPEQHSINFSADLLDNWSLTPSGTLIGSYVSVSSFSVEVESTDSYGARSSIELVLPMNAAPHLLGNGRLAARVGEDYSVDFMTLFADLEGDAMSFTVNGLPAGLAFQAGKIVGKPSNAGDFSLFVTASDERGAVTNHILQINISDKSGSSFGFIWLFMLISLVGTKYYRSKS